MNKSGYAKLIGSVLLAAAVLALYARTASFTYLRLDDWGYTAGCPFVAGGLSWANICEAFSRLTYGGIWMPLTYISYAADVTLFGGGWGVHHAVNAILHAANAVIAFFFLLEFLSARRDPRTPSIHTTDTAMLLAAFTAALFWAVHPQRAEAVAWIASRKEELWTLFAMSGLIAWRRGVWWAGYLCCALACISKPTAVIFPFLALLVDWFEERKLARALLRALPLLAMAGFTGLVAIASQKYGLGNVELPLADTPFLARAWRFATALGSYVAQMVLPIDIHFDYLKNPVAVSLVSLPAAASLLVFRDRRILFAALLFILPLLPTSGLVGAFGEHARADRFIYMASVGASFALAVFLVRWPRLCKYFAVICLAYAAAAWPVIGSYRNNLSAFSRALECDENHWRALRHVGSEYCARMGRMDEGIEMLRRSMRISQRDSTAEALAYVLACRGDKTDAPEIKRLCRKAAARPELDSHGMMAESLGVVAMWESRYSHAIRCFKASLAAPARSYRQDEARFRLAECHIALDDKASARAILRPLAVSEDKQVRQRAFSELEKLNHAQ